jgi:hypothetical protein
MSWPCVPGVPGAKWGSSDGLANQQRKVSVTDIYVLVVIPASTRVLACKVDFGMDNPL